MQLFYRIANNTRPLGMNKELLVKELNKLAWVDFVHVYNCATAYWNQNGIPSKEYNEVFMQRLSHELRTPLHIITGFTQVMLLAEETVLECGIQIEGDLQRIRTASITLLSVIEELLNPEHSPYAGYDLSKVQGTGCPNRKLCPWYWPTIEKGIES